MRLPPTPCRVCFRPCVFNKFSHFWQKSLLVGKTKKEKSLQSLDLVRLCVGGETARAKRVCEVSAR